MRVSDFTKPILVSIIQKSISGGTKSHSKGAMRNLVSVDERKYLLDGINSVSYCTNSQSGSSYVLQSNGSIVALSRGEWCEDQE